MRHVINKWLVSTSSISSVSEDVLLRSLKQDADRKLQDNDQCLRGLVAYRRMVLSDGLRLLRDFNEKLTGWMEGLLVVREERRVLIAFSLIRFGMVRYRREEPRNSLALFKALDYRKFLARSKVLLKLIDRKR